MRSMQFSHCIAQCIRMPCPPTSSITHPSLRCSSLLSATDFLLFVLAVSWPTTALAVSCRRRIAATVPSQSLVSCELRVQVVGASAQCSLFSSLQLRCPVPLRFSTAASPTPQQHVLIQPVVLRRKNRYVKCAGKCRRASLVHKGQRHHLLPSRRVLLTLGSCGRVRGMKQQTQGQLRISGWFACRHGASV